MSSSVEERVGEPAALGQQDPSPRAVLLEPRAGNGPLVERALGRAREASVPVLGPPRRRWLRRGGGQEAVALGVIAQREPAGARVRLKAGRARRGWYAPVASGAPTTTRQAEILNPALVAAPTDVQGIAIGRDRFSNAPVSHDPFTAYLHRVITSPSVIVIGAIGAGKSSLIKTVYVLRPMILRGRRAVVLDRKDRGDEGEYCELTRELGGEPFKMRIGGGGTVLNPLDPAIAAVIGAAGQFGLLRAMAERGNNDEPLDKWEAEALRVAHQETLRAAEQDGAEPLIEHLVAQLGRVHPAWDDLSGPARERIHQAGVGVRFLFAAMLGRDLAGLFDGPTSPHVRLDAKLTTFDISQLPQDGPATAMVLAVAHAWLLGTLRKDRGQGTNFIVEEGWDMVTGPIGRQMNANQMLARGLGLSNVAAIHHIAQVNADAAAASLIREPQTVHIYRQDRDADVRACVQMYGLDQGAGQALPNLGDGHHLLKIGNRSEIHVEHVRSALEEQLTDTDEGMLVGGGRS